MAELKTKPTSESVSDFIEQVASPQKKDDAKTLLKALHEITGEDPVMCGDSVIGYGKYRFKYKSGRGLDWFLSGFSPRKQNLTVYMMDGFMGQETLLKQLGKHTKSVGCLYIKKLADIEMEVLKQMIDTSIRP